MTESTIGKFCTSCAMAAIGLASLIIAAVMIWVYTL